MNEYLKFLQTSCGFKKQAPEVVRSMIFDCVKRRGRAICQSIKVPAADYIATRHGYEPITLSTDEAF